ncbi:uncharacterized protein LOC122497597 [Leptopilina heterotoma]|uniref:uncharacterized protein LOC122497597 n=1 Tax=Leptopilina heterotoma TaxID=63436 RepID=UPI001CA852FC|nr:uncharacterized protein LOC122497597 [Leptopilina heterotoma]
MLKLVKRIRGQDLSQNVNEEVILMGKLGMLSPNGKSFELVTLDDVKVNVSLSEPFDGNSDCYLEVHGTVQSKTTVLCTAFFVFPTEDNLNVANENYNEMLLVGNLLGDKKWSTGDGPSF